MAKQKLQNLTPYNLRLQPDLKAKLERLSRISGRRSLHAEIVHRLEASLEERDELSQFSTGELIDELIKRLGQDNVALSLKIGDA